MKHVFSAPTSVSIPDDRAKRIKSAIKVPKLEGRIVKAEIVFSMQHADARDLRVQLEAPNTQFIQVASWPRDRMALDGAIRTQPVPSSLLTNLKHEGDWNLVIDDKRARDGGVLNWWRLELDVVPSSFEIELDFMGGLTETQKQIFESCARRWSEVIVGALTPAKIGTRNVSNVLIFAEGREIDGPGSVLGQAGPTHLRSSSFLPIAGQMAFDRADLSKMEDSGMLRDVILHEMAHVLGFGTIWRYLHMLDDAGNFIGKEAVAIWNKMEVPDVPTGAKSVPIEKSGGPGTRGSHWDEDVFDNELMTGWIDRGRNPLSELTVASMADLGYEVDASSADLYPVPAMKLSTSTQGRVCRLVTSHPVVVPGT